MPDREPIPIGTRTWSASQVADEVIGCSIEYMRQQLHDNVWPGSKIANRWRLTEADIKEILHLTRNTAISPNADPAGLTPRSRAAYERRRRTA